MPHVPDLQSLLSAAEQAAAAGEHASAERFLREAAALQEAHLGPLHPDLARTLNNLAVACEMADNPVDAEHYFRRAYVTARTVLDADHPFVSTSRRNLEEFCAARGKPVKLAAPAALAVAATGDVPAAGAAHDTPREQPTPNERSQSDVPGWWKTGPVIAAAVAAILLLTIAGVTWFRSVDRTGSLGARAMSPDAHTTSEARLVPTTPAGAPEGVDTAPDEPTVVEQPAAAAATAGRTDGAEVRTAATSDPRAPVVVVAQLCRTLSTGGREWQCVPAGRAIDPGPLFFYTRLKSSTAVRVQHRWYRGDRVHRVVDLSVGANTGDGYRTYSRSTVAPLSSGDWKIELRTTDGIVLHEERFVVR